MMAYIQRYTKVLNHPVAHLVAHGVRLPALKTIWSRLQEVPVQFGSGGGVCWTTFLFRPFFFCASVQLPCPNYHHNIAS
jgi:hypothetical protein